MNKMNRALLSVSDKTGIVAFAQVLASVGIEIISTGGTAKILRDAGLKVKDISEYTGFPEILDGRVKTLHPKIHGGLLFVRGNKEHEATIEQYDIEPIDLVVVNLYPFENTVAKPDVTLFEAIENIDIGGPSMLRSAAKNHESVTVVVDPSDYLLVATEIKNNGNTSLELRRKLAAKVFARTAAYDAAIAAHLEKQFKLNEELPTIFTLTSARAQNLRYGENPHQKAALYGRFNEYFRQLHGKELSYNNILDLCSAANLISEFLDDSPTVAILKHTNPCGVAWGKTLKEAWDKAYATDKQAPFGGIIAVNKILDEQCAMAISEIFSEVIIAPDFTTEAFKVLQKKKNLRLMQMVKPPSVDCNYDIRTVGANSFLVQQPDIKSDVETNWKVVTDRPPTKNEMAAMKFGWKIVKHVKSNAIVFVAPDRTLGIGAGQMSRVDSVRIAIWKAAEAGLPLEGSVVCSDAFFPFPDGVISAAEAGAAAVIQPGGSIRDQEVIKAANEKNIAMVFTGTRHFRH